jgi:hypothetical protein
MNAKYLGCDDKKPPNKEVKPLFFFYKQNQDLLLQKKARTSWSFLPLETEHWVNCVGSIFIEHR